MDPDNSKKINELLSQFMKNLDEFRRDIKLLKKIVDVQTSVISQTL